MPDAPEKRKRKPGHVTDSLAPEIVGLTLTPLQMLGVLLKVVLRDRITSSEIDHICASYYQAITKWFPWSPYDSSTSDLAQRHSGRKVKLDPKELVSKATAARMRGVSKQAIEGLIKRGRLKTVVIDGHTYLFKKEVENYKPGVGGRPKPSAKKPRPKKSN